MTKKVGYTKQTPTSRISYHAADACLSLFLAIADLTERNVRFESGDGATLVELNFKFSTSPLVRRIFL